MSPSPSRGRITRIFLTARFLVVFAFVSARGVGYSVPATTGVYIRFARGQSSTDMSSIDEKRVYGATEGKTDVFIATGMGVARVECSGDLVGGFGLVHRCVATDIAAKGNRLAVATDEDVLVWNRDEFDPAGFGPAHAVGYNDELIAAGSGRISRSVENDWSALGVSESGDKIDVRAIDGDLIASSDGVYRLSDGANGVGYVPVGLNNARDVSSVPIPLVATATGLYQLKNGWVNVLDADVHLIESDGTRIHAATDEALYAPCKSENTSEHQSHNAQSDEWERLELPVAEQIAGIGHGESTYAVTVDGTFLIESDDGWHTRSLGLSDVSGLAVR